MLEPTKKPPTEAVLTIKGPAGQLARLQKTLGRMGFAVVEPLPAPEEPAIPWRESLGVSPEDEPGCHLRGARLKEGLTQKELAVRLGLSQHHISEMEHNKRTIGKDMARRLGTALDVDYRLFL